MAEMKPIGVDQTTGQQRAVEKGGIGIDASWSANGEFLSIAHATTPFITTYQTSQAMPDSGIITIKGVIREGN